MVGTGGNSGGGGGRSPRLQVVDIDISMHAASPTAKRFKEVASLRGAYAEQIAAGCAAVDAALLLDDVHTLASLLPELERILTNISCRLPQRDPALRPQRDELAALCSRLRGILRARGVVRGRSPTKASAVAADCVLLNTFGPRHLCKHGCYLSAFEGSRNLAVRAFADFDGSTTVSGTKRRRQLVVCDDESWAQMVVTSRFFDESKSGALRCCRPGADVGGTSARPGPWRPPHSPFGLLEELFWDRPWALLLCCILLNQTTRAQVDPVLASLLCRFPDAAALATAGVAEVEEILRPLGLHRRRARTLIAFSIEFLKGAWRRPDELPGIGQYACDAHAIFCEGRWKRVEPMDHALRWYVRWMRTMEASSAGEVGG